MSVWGRLRRRARQLGRPRDVEVEMEEEMRFHVEMETEDYLRQGLDPGAARKRALVTFGGVERFKEEGREARRVRPFHDLGRDVRYALRMLARSPGFTAAAVLTLALGIGGVTAIFSVVNAVLLRPLPFAAEDELVIAWSSNPERNQERYFISPQDYADWRAQARTLSGLGAFWPHQVTLSDPGEEPIGVTATMTSANFFDVLGVRPVLGRAFVEQDGQPGAPQVAVLGYATWRDRYGSDPAVIGRVVSVDGTGTEIVGVLPPGLSLPDDGAVWTNINFPFSIQTRSTRWLSVVGRMAPETSLDGARSDLANVAAGLAREYAATNEGWGVEVASLRDVVVGDVRPALLLLLGATGLILLIACANVANLLLSRAETRRREMAVRAALGAGRTRILRQLITESVVLAAAGAAGGVLLTAAGLRLLVAASPGDIPRLGEITIDATVLGVVLAGTLLTAVAFGIAPVAHLLNRELLRPLRESGKSTAPRERQRLRGGLVVAEIALAVVLLIGSGLLVKSFVRVRATDPGFRAGGLLTFELNTAPGAYPQYEAVVEFYTRLIRTLEAMPGVVSATMATTLPLGESADYRLPIGIVGRDPRPGEEPDQVYYREVGPDFFSTMGVPLMAGRELTALDGPAAPGVVVINESLQRMYWPNSDPIGERITNVAGAFGPLGRIDIRGAEVVGVVKDVKYGGLKLAAEPSLYFAHSQAPFRRMTIAIRTSADPATLMAAARSAVAELDPRLPINRMATMPDVVAQSIASDRFTALLLTIFAGVALLLAAVGIYGILAYTVARRATEVGIRMALGAGAADVLRLVMGQAVGRIALGLAFGLGGGLALSRLLASQLYGVNPWDPWVMAAVSATLAVVALAASFVPALRATGVDPVVALRDD